MIRPKSHHDNVQDDYMMVTTTLPETGVLFQVYKDVLCSKSYFMRVSLYGNTREAEENKTNLTEEDDEDSLRTITN